MTGKEKERVLTDNICNFRTDVTQIIQNNKGALHKNKCFFEFIRKIRYKMFFLRPIKACS